MGLMQIVAAASAFPKNEYDQNVLLAALARHWGPKLENPLFLDRLHARVGVDKRNLTLTIPEYEAMKTWGEANNHWIEHSTNLGEECLRAALLRAGLQPEDIGAIFFVSIMASAVRQLTPAS